MSKTDESNEKLFEEYEKKFSQKEDAKSFFGMLNQYKETIRELQNKIVWEKLD